MLNTHKIRIDSEGKIVPWNYDDPAIAYDDILDRVWNFWNNVPNGQDGMPLYMTAQIANRVGNDGRGIAGDIFAMIIDSWMHLYRYTGNREVYFNMRFIADTYIKYGFSPENCKWPNLPFPYNTSTFTHIYDGDMILGKGFLQPDKAGSFGLALVKMYKICDRDSHRDVYLEWAVKIANTLAANCRKGDFDHSPWPFKVNAYTGEIGAMHKSKNTGVTEIVGYSEYTSNMTYALMLFEELCKLGVGNTALYQKTFDEVLAWLKAYPLQNNRWGPYHEDVPGWSDTHENAVACAQFIMGHKDLFEDWQSKVLGIFNWIEETLGNHDWEEFGVIPTNEQTGYRIPGNSHTAHQASAELQYVHESGDSTLYEGAIRKLNWATYMVDENGDNVYIDAKNYSDLDWFSDGYSEYVRHYLMAMSYCPELAPYNEDHIVSSTSVVNFFFLRPELEKYIKLRSFDDSEEVIKLVKEPKDVIIENAAEGDGWDWTPTPDGAGLLRVKHSKGTTVYVIR